MCAFRKIYSAILLMASFSVFAPSASASLINPSFDQGLDGWVDLSGNGSASVVNGAAVLSTGTGVDIYSAVVAQGDDGSFSFGNPITLSPTAQKFEFDLWLISHSADSSEVGSSILADSLTLSFYDANDFFYDVVFTGLSFSSSLTKLSFDISSLAGRSVALYFELRDEDDGFDVSLGIDNLAVIESPTTVPVPESSSLFLMLLTSMFFFLRRKFA